MGTGRGPYISLETSLQRGTIKSEAIQCGRKGKYICGIVIKFYPHAVVVIYSYYCITDASHRFFVFTFKITQVTFMMVEPIEYSPRRNSLVVLPTMRFLNRTLLL